VSGDAPGPSGRARRNGLSQWPYERANGRERADISQRRDGTGFDIRSLGPIPATGEREVRRIEVKGRSAPTGDVGLYRTEWFAAQRFRGGS